MPRPTLFARPPLRSLLVAFWLSTALLPSLQAQPKPPPDTKEAKALFEQGMALSTEGKWAEALDAFERSNKLVSLPVVQYNIAYNLRALGRYVEAKQRLLALVEASQTAKPPFKPQLKQDIDQLLDEVRQKIVRIRLTLDPADGDLEIDGTAARLPPDRTLEMDPGKHVFLLKKEGYETTSVSRTLSASDQALTITAPALPPPPVVLSSGPPPPPPPRPFYSRPLFLTVAGIVVAVGAGAVVYLVTRPEETRQPAQPPPNTYGSPILANFRF